jgi:hypothetical protein
MHHLLAKALALHLSDSTKQDQVIRERKVEHNVLARVMPMRECAWRSASEFHFFIQRIDCNQRSISHFLSHPKF